MTRVSVLIPAYRPDPGYLQQALASLFAQTETDWECIIHCQPDAGDWHGAIATYLADPRVHFIQSTVLRTIGENWNACLPYATAPYIAYLFADDLWEPNYLTTLADILDRNPSVGFVSANRSYRFEGDVPRSPVYDEVRAFTAAHVQPGRHDGMTFLRWWMDQGLRPNIIGEPSFVLLRRSLMEQAGPFHRAMVQFLDSEYWTRCLAHGDWYWEPRVLGTFRVHPGATTAQNEQSGEGLTDRLVTFERAVYVLPKGQRAHAKKALQHALADMLRRFFRQKKEGTQTAPTGSGKSAVLRFGLRHPLLLAGALREARWDQATSQRSNPS